MKITVSASSRVTASESLNKVPSDYAKWYRVQPFSEVEDLMGSEEAKEFLNDQNEMLKEYGAKVVGFVAAKDKYYDALSNNGLEYATVMKEPDGDLHVGFFVHDRFMPLDINEIEMCIGYDDWDEDEDVEGATAEDLQKRFAEYTNKQNQVGKQLDDLQSQAKKKFGFGKSKITADVWDEISQVDQEFTSENTSINSTKLPAIFKMIKLPEGSINLDFGGGRFDNVAEYLEPLGVINLVYDPYNRSAEHNQEVVKTLKDAGGADSATCSNVLNVIKEPEARLNVLKNISKMVKPGGDVYITVYEGTGKGDEGATKSGYQLNRKTADYLEEVQQVFPNAERKGKLIVATN